MAFKKLNNETTSVDNGGSFDTGGQEPISITSESAANALQAANSAAAALVSENAAAADLVLTNADVVLTHADVVLTNADLALTNADVVLTNADVVLAEADKVQTGLDRIAVAADRVLTNQDAQTTAANLALTNADVVLTNADVVLTNADVALAEADKVQTGLDRIATNADVVLTHADVVLTNADVVLAEADKVQTGLDRIATNADVVLTHADVVLTNADVLLADADRVQTGLDRVATAADVVSTNADVVLTNADVVLTNADVVSAGNSVTAAALSAPGASNSQIAAASSAASAAAIFDQFDDTYLGSKSSEPTVDNDGNALSTGALFYNSSTQGMFIWTGSEWVAASAAGGASLNNFSYTATAGQTTFSGSDENSNTMSYTVDNIIVTLNGIVLEGGGTDYTATNGSSIVLTSGATVSDEVNIVAFKTFTTADMVSASNGGAYQGNVDFLAGIDVTGNITVTGTVDGRDVAADGVIVDGLGTASTSAATDFVAVTGDTMTGALTTTGLNVNGDLSVSAANSRMRLYETDTTDLNTQLQNQAGDFNIARLDDDAGNSTVQLNIDHATGNVSIPNGNLDVTGTITSDGLTVDGTPVRFNSVAPMLYFMEAGVTDQNHRIRQNAGNLYFQKLSDDENTATTNMVIDGGTGDINFYATDGTTQAFHWDAADESLDIGGVTTSTLASLRLKTAGSNDAIALNIEENSGNEGWGLGVNAAGDLKFYNSGAGTATGLSAVTFSDDNNVGIGVSSPSAPLSISGSAFNPAAGGYATGGIDLQGATAGNGNYTAGLGFRMGTRQSTAIITGVQDTTDSDRVGLAFFTNPDGSGATAADEVMRISSSGSVGIGTSSPNIYSGYGAMTINGTTGSLLDFEINGTVTGELYADSGITDLGIGLQAVGSRIVHFKTNNQERMRISATGDMELIQSNNLYWKHEGGGTIRAGITADSSDNLTFSTGSSDSTAMTITSDGHIGIGDGSTDSLMARIDQGYLSTRVKNFNITSGGSAYAFTGVNIYQDTSGAYKYIDNAASSSIHYWGGDIQFHTATSGSADATQGSTERMRISSDGGFGFNYAGSPTSLSPDTGSPLYAFRPALGANAPQNYLNFGGTNRNGNGVSKMLSFNHGYWGASKEVAAVGVETISSASGSGRGYGSLVFYTGESGNGDSGSTSAEKMRISYDGRTFMGTDATLGTNAARLEVYTVGSGGRIIQTKTDSNGNTNHLTFNTPSGQAGQIYTNTLSTTYATSSDHRLKENVVELTGATDRLKQLNPSRFNFIADADTTVDGFLAHEVQDIVPEAIHGTKDAMRDEEYEVTPAVEATYDDEGNELTAGVDAVMGTRSVPEYQGIDQSKLVPLLTAALQEALTKIEAMEARLAALEGV
jgi:hypothetical protein